MTSSSSRIGPLLVESGQIGTKGETINKKEPQINYNDYTPSMSTSKGAPPISAPYLKKAKRGQNINRKCPKPTSSGARTNHDH